MAENLNSIEKLNIGGKEFDLTAWGQSGMSKLYFLTLLSRDEYTPVAEKQPTETDVLYVDPASGNQAGFHAGQCVIYPDSEVEDGWGLSIAKQVETNVSGIPTKVYWFHATDVEKELKKLNDTNIPTFILEVVGINNIPTGTTGKSGGASIAKESPINSYQKLNEILANGVKCIIIIKDRLTNFSYEFLGKCTDPSAAFIGIYGYINYEGNFLPLYLRMDENTPYVPYFTKYGNIQLPVATTSLLGSVKSTKTGTTSGRDYAVEVNADGTMKVNVPWQLPDVVQDYTNGLMSWELYRQLVTLVGGNKAYTHDLSQSATITYDNTGGSKSLKFTGTMIPGRSATVIIVVAEDTVIALPGSHIVGNEMKHLNGDTIVAPKNSYVEINVLCYKSYNNGTVYTTRFSITPNFIIS